MKVKDIEKTDEKNEKEDQLDQRLKKIEQSMLYRLLGNVRHLSK